MRRHIFGIILAVVFLFSVQPVRADSLTFTVLPPDISGTPGETIGWGYSITNNSATDYLDLTQVDATVFTIGAADSFPFFLSFVPLAPGATETQAYDGTDILGLYEVAIDPGATPGEMDSGIFGLYGAFCDPSDPGCVEDGSVAASSTPLATADYSATVVAAGGTPIPEPASMLLLISGLCAIGLWLFHRESNSGWR